MRVALLVAAVASLALAQPHGSHHGHRHLRRVPQPHEVEKRDAVTEVVPGPTVVVYELDGEIIPNSQAENGLGKGKYKVAGESTPTPPSEGAQFFEQGRHKTSSSSSPPAPTSTTQEPSPAAETPQQSPASTSPTTGGTATGIDAEFQDGKLDCSTFPSDYGAVAVDWMKLGGWSGLQLPTALGSDGSIADMRTGVAGEGCTEGYYCSYACPPGYLKTQWPESQGSTKQSVGGIKCQGGKLHLTRPSVKTLCTPGAGGVTIKNDLNVEVSTCRTDYPGTENMVIPTVAQGGESGLALANVDGPNYYIWDGKITSAQYYVNKKGRGPDTTCLWGNIGDDFGNYAPVNIGLGKNENGETFISIFANKPSSTAQLDFNIAIEGATAECKLEGGQYTGGGDGCTTSFPSGGNVVVRFY